ncbi:MAG: hypothetical protein AB9846_00195 [Tenuifilaceae bacterium]
MNDSFLEVRSLNLLLPEPVALNCWKHHLGNIKSHLVSDSLLDINKLQESISSIGDSILDLYIGNLDCFNISHQVLNHKDLVINSGVIDYRSWLTNGGKEFKCVLLSDGSSWTLRLGNDLERYIHIHPSRYSPYTIRLRGSTLKTSIAYLLQFGFDFEDFTVEKVNMARQNFTNLPPLKSNSPLIAVSRIMKLFFD